MTQYRDDLDAARARIETLEAKLREREASLDAREAELSELRSEIARLRRDPGGAHASLRDPETTAGQRALLVALAACGFTLLAGYAMVRPATCGMARMRQASSVPRMPAELTRMPSISPGVESPAPDLFPTIAPPASVLEDGERDFDRKAASRALKRAAMEARSCADEGGPTGLTKVDVTFQPNGEVSAVQMTPDVVGTPAALCLYKVFGKAHVPPFEGEEVTVSKSVNLR